MGDDAGEEEVDEANARRHGRPLVVIPLHVTAGFFESERGRIDSGVLGICGIVFLSFGRDGYKSKQDVKRGRELMHIT